MVLLALRTGQPGQPGGSIALFHEDGRSAGSIQLPPDTQFTATAGTHVLITTAAGTLYGYTADGSRVVLGQVGAGLGSFIADTKGDQWIWTTHVAGQSTVIHRGGVGLSPRVLASVNYPLFLEPFAWTASGVYLSSSPPDYTGYLPFPNAWAAFGGIRKLNPTDGSLAVRQDSVRCIFSDESTDGSIACFPALPSYLTPTLHTLRIVQPGAKSTDLTLATPRFNYVGDAYFSPDGSLLTVAGATGAGDGSPFTGSQNPKPEQFGTDLVHVADQSIARFGPDGVRPSMGRQSWLPDGRLVLWRPAGAAGGEAGLYLVDRNGSVQGGEILTSGTPIGYITAE
jgi:hypothetical protein